jgi:putative oxidoreductase
VNPTTLPSIGLLVLRLVVGVTFLVHGLDKLVDLTEAERLFAAQSIPIPWVMAPFVAVTEIVGGGLLIAGLATPLVAAALTIDMLVALLTTHIDQGFFVADGGMELVLLLGVASLAIALAGPGRFSVDAVSGLGRQVSVETALRLTRRISVAPAPAPPEPPQHRSTSQAKGKT